MSSPEPTAAPRCVRCHRDLAPGQRIEHRGALYCLECVGQALNGQTPPTALRRSPPVAVILSLLPGLGQMYNRQVVKGALVLGGFMLLATGQGPFVGWEQAGLNTALLVVLYFWNLFDAYWAAQRINRAELPQPSGAEPQALEAPTAPLWGALLIVLGVLFLLNNFGVAWLTWDRLWPTALMVVGIWMLVSFALSRRGASAPLPPENPDRAPEVHHD